MLTQAENLQKWLAEKETSLKHCEVSIAERGVIYIRSSEYINVFAPLDRAGKLFGYRVDQRGRDFDCVKTYFVRMVRDGKR